MKQQSKFKQLKNENLVKETATRVFKSRFEMHWIATASHIEKFRFHKQAKKLQASLCSFLYYGKKLNPSLVAALLLTMRFVNFAHKKKILSWLARSFFFRLHKTSRFSIAFTFTASMTSSFVSCFSMSLRMSFMHIVCNSSNGNFFAYLLLLVAAAVVLEYVNSYKAK